MKPLFRKIVFSCLIATVSYAKSTTDRSEADRDQLWETNLVPGNDSAVEIEADSYYYSSMEDEEIDPEVLKDFADIDVDNFDVFFKSRWSYAPGFVERLCVAKCQEDGKHFGRLIGAKCRCYCPLNAAELNLCSATGVCDKFCASIKFYKGGDCVFNNVCFCYCKPGDAYNVATIYTLEGSSTPSPPTTNATSTTTTLTPATNSTSNSTKYLGNKPRPHRPRTRSQLVDLRRLEERLL